MRLAGLRVSVRIGAREITVSHAGALVARHPRLQGRYQHQRDRLDHYLELLERKPGALKGSLPLRQERERGRWPACFDELWQRSTVRYGGSEAARQMVDVLLLIREHGPGRVELAVQGALAAGAHDGRAVARARPPQRAAGAAAGLFELPEPRLRCPRPARADTRRLRRAAQRGATVSANAKTAALEALVEAHAVELNCRPSAAASARSPQRQHVSSRRRSPTSAALLEAEVQRAGRAPRAPPPARRPLPPAQTARRLPLRRQPHVPQATIAALAEGSWIDDRESIILIGDSGTGKTHLAIALAICACQARTPRPLHHPRRPRQRTPRSRGRRELARVVGRYARIELLVLDELGYLALPEGAAELVFQVISERNERASLIVTTNLPFGEWTKVFPDPRLAKAVVDRLTHRAHIIDTGSESWRFKHGLAQQQTPPTHTAA